MCSINDTFAMRGNMIHFRCKDDKDYNYITPCGMYFPKEFTPESTEVTCKLCLRKLDLRKKRLDDLH